MNEVQKINENILEIVRHKTRGAGGNDQDLIILRDIIRGQGPRFA